MRKYAELAGPLTDALRKDGFRWGSAEEEAFEKLKVALTTTPLLAFPDFSVPFVVETESCGVGVGAVLLQREHPIAYFSKKLSPLRQQASVYVKELWAITEAVKKWRHYLLGSFFTIRTDHKTLKNLLDQVIQTPEQQFFLSKLLSYSYDIVYKKGKNNAAADALSRIPEIEIEEGARLCSMVSVVTSDWLDRIKWEQQNDKETSELIGRVERGEGDPRYSWDGIILKFGGRLYISANSLMRKEILTELHCTKFGGHSGYLRTLHRVKQLFFWRGMSRFTRDFVAECRIFQQSKVPAMKPLGLLHLLDIPSDVWESISMDFVSGLPPVKGHAIWVHFQLITRLSQWRNTLYKTWYDCTSFLNQSSVIEIKSSWVNFGGS